MWCKIYWQQQSHIATTRDSAASSSEAAPKDKEDEDIFNPRKFVFTVLLIHRVVRLSRHTVTMWNTLETATSAMSIAIKETLMFQSTPVTTHKFSKILYYVTSQTHCHSEKFTGKSRDTPQRHKINFQQQQKQH